MGGLIRHVGDAGDARVGGDDGDNEEIGTIVSTFLTEEHGVSDEHFSGWLHASSAASAYLIRQRLGLH